MIFDVLQPASALSLSPHSLRSPRRPYVPPEPASPSPETLAPALRQATALLRSMGTDGAPAADTACFNAAIVACDRGGQWARAAALVAELRGRGLR